MQPLRLSLPHNNLWSGWTFGRKQVGLLRQEPSLENKFITQPFCKWTILKRWIKMFTIIKWSFLKKDYLNLFLKSFIVFALGSSYTLVLKDRLLFEEKI
jgi:hypothetical protein